MTELPAAVSTLTNVRLSLNSLGSSSSPLFWYLTPIYYTFANVALAFLGTIIFTWIVFIVEEAVRGQQQTVEAASRPPPPQAFN